MSFGKCNQCGKKVGRRSANGVFLPDLSKISQVEMIFGIPGSAKKTHVHVVVCKACAANPRYEKIERGLKDDKSFKGFLKTKHKDSILEQIREEKHR